MRTIRRQMAMVVLAASMTCAAGAGRAALPEGGLDFGSDGLAIPEPIYVNVTTPRTALLLADALKVETVPFRKVRLLQDLGASRLAEAVPPVVAVLDDSEPSVRLAAAEAIAVLVSDASTAEASRAKLAGNTEVAAKLKKLIADSDPRVRAAALRALAGIDPAGDAVARALAGSDEAMLSAAIDVARTPEQAKALLERLDTVPAALKPRAYLAIGKTKPQGGVQKLVQIAAADRAVPELASACQALGLTAAPEALPRLTELLAHKHSTVRREATLAAGACAGADDARKLGVRMLQDSDGTVRQAAAMVLRPHMTAEIVPSLVPHLGDPYKPLWKAARESLAAAPAGAAREATIRAAGELLGHADARRREDGSYLLGRFRSDYQFEKHLALLSHEDPELVAQVAESLGLIGRPEARGPIVELARKADSAAAGTKQMAAANALVAGARLGAAELLPECERILRSSPMYSYHPARCAAAFAVGAVGKPDSPQVDALYAPLVGTMEGVATKFEAVKSLGNLRVPGAAERIAAFPMSDRHELQWIIQWATARITQRAEEHPPTQYKWIAETSIKDRTGQP